MDVCLSLEKSGEARAEGFGTFFELDDQKIAGAKWDAAFDKKSLDGFRVANNESGDCDVDGVLQTETQHQDMSIAKETDDAEESTRAVDEKDGKLFDVGAGSGGIGFHAWMCDGDGKVGDGQCC